MSASGLGRVETLWQKTACGFRAPNPFTITGERGLADRRWNEASLVSEARIRRITGLMTRAQPGPYVLRAAISGWMPRMFNTRVRL
jgi:hypothetical protein